MLVSTLNCVLERLSSGDIALPVQRNSWSRAECNAAENYKFSFFNFVSVGHIVSADLETKFRYDYTISFKRERTYVIEEWIWQVNILSRHCITWEILDILHSIVLAFMLYSTEKKILSPGYTAIFNMFNFNLILLLKVDYNLISYVPTKFLLFIDLYVSCYMMIIILICFLSFVLKLHRCPFKISDTNWYPNKYANCSKWYTYNLLWH